MINKILCAMFFTRVSEIEVCGIKKVSLIICIFTKLWRFSVNHGPDCTSIIILKLQ
jgi:hypothetical protein